MSSREELPSDRVDRAILTLSQDPDIQAIVRGIESDPIPLTKNNYGRYGELLSTLSKGQRPMAYVIAQAFVRCGANEDGVADGFRLFIAQ